MSGDGREYLLDVTRLIWRAWRGHRPTGIDRVALAYLQHFASRSVAVVQRRGFVRVLTPAQTDQLSRLLLRKRVRRFDLLTTLVASALSARPAAPRPGMIYLNVGHTGLNDAALPTWLRRNKSRAIYLVHDLIPVTHPQYCRAGEAEKHARRMETVLATAEGVIGNSQDTLAALADFAASAGRPFPKAIVAWIAGPAPKRGLRARSIEKPYFLMVGTIEARKNHLMILRLWERLVRDQGSAAPALVIVGHRGWEAADTFHMLDHLGPLAGYIHEIGDCDDDELVSWLKGACALLMPSHVEGFGLPVVESLELGTPVIASDLPVYREIAGDIPTYLGRTDSGSWEAAIRSFCEGGPERAAQLHRMKDYRAPTWEQHFASIERWLSNL